LLENYENTAGGYFIKETYLNPGDEISACSAAAGYKVRLLLGAVFENYFLDFTTIKK